MDGSVFDVPSGRLGNICDNRLPNVMWLQWHEATGGAGQLSGASQSIAVQHRLLDWPVSGR
jgi:hypothetical protein